VYFYPSGVQFREVATLIEHESLSIHTIASEYRPVVLVTETLGQAGKDDAVLSSSLVSLNQSYFC